jgi:hypothetical protein
LKSFIGSHIFEWDFRQRHSRECGGMKNSEQSNDALLAFTLDENASLYEMLATSR